MSYARRNHTFIVRLWLEPRDKLGAEPEWRGEVEHVPSGQSRHVRGVDDAARFITSYLEAPEDWRSNCAEPSRAE